MDIIREGKMVQKCIPKYEDIRKTLHYRKRKGIKFVSNAI